VNSAEEIFTAPASDIPVIPNITIAIAMAQLNRTGSTTLPLLIVSPPMHTVCTLSAILFLGKFSRQAIVSPS
jgi:hypothetical protein